jgi:hypothetical protein
VFNGGGVIVRAGNPRTQTYGVAHLQPRTASAWAAGMIRQNGDAVH